MADGRGGKRPGAGNPGYGKMEFVKQKVLKFSPLWWREWEKMMKGSADEKRFAMVEFNRLQLKMIPQDVTSGGEKLPIPILSGITQNYDNEKG